MVQRKRILKCKDLEKSESEKNLYHVKYKILTEEDLSILFRSLKYKIGGMYNLVNSYGFETPIECLASKFHKKEELRKYIKYLNVSSDDENEIQNALLEEGKRVGDYLFGVLGSLVNFLLLIPDTREFYQKVCEILGSKEWSLLDSIKLSLDVLWKVDYPYELTGEVVHEMLTSHYLMPADKDWEEKTYSFIEYFFCDRHKDGIFQESISQFYDFLKTLVTKMLSGKDEVFYISETKKSEYVYKRMILLNGDEKWKVISEYVEDIVEI